MNALAVVIGLLAATASSAGDHWRSINVDGIPRSYRYHVPPRSDCRPGPPLPVVLIFHGAAINSDIMVWYCGLNDKADKAGFIAVYPNGAGVGILRAFNAGGVVGKLAATRLDDVKFTAAMLDDLATVVRVDRRRVYATGISNGGMMCYRLAAELSDRIAAIAPVSGTMAIGEAHPGRPVPVMHIHGTADAIVPFTGPARGTPSFLKFMSVKETLKIWTDVNQCDGDPIVEALPDKTDDDTTVTRKSYRPRAGGAEVILFEIKNGGHTWPGRKSPVSYLGKSCMDISANDLIWEFFSRHRLP